MRTQLPAGGDGISSFFVREDVRAGDLLIAEGRPPTGVIYLEDGAFAVTIRRLDGGGGHRIRILEPGSIVGEIGWYDGSPATANVEAMSPGVVWRLLAEGFGRLEAEEPGAAAAFHKMTARLLAGRVRDVDRSIRALLGGGSEHRTD